MNYIFDYEGTLVDSKKCVQFALRKAFTIHGLAMPTQTELIEISTNISDHLNRLPVIKSLSDQQLSDFLETLRKEYMLARQQCVRLNDNGHQVIQELSKKGVLIVISGKSTTDLVRELSFLGLIEYVKAYGFDCFSKFKPHPDYLDEVARRGEVDASATTFVGNSYYDIMMAKSLGMRACAYAENEETVNKLTRCHPDRLIRNLSELLNDDV